METLMVGQKVITYELTRSTRAKRINIMVYPDKVRVAVPRGISEEVAKQFVESKKQWILKHLEAFQACRHEMQERRYVDGEEFFYRGARLKLEVLLGEGKKVMVQREANNLKVMVPQQVPAPQRADQIQAALILWYRQEARKIFREKLNYYAGLMGVSYNQLRVKEQKTRWGSCSSKRNINLNWRIVLAPDHVINYLIIHELSHLKFMDHSPEFWRMVEAYMPDYEHWRSWLKDNGSQLMI